MEKLNLIVNSLLKKIKLKKNKKQDSILKILNKILTKEETKHIKYISLYRDTLKLVVDSSVWLYYLNQKKEKILKKLKIKEIKLLLG